MVALSKLHDDDYLSTLSVRGGRSSGLPSRFVTAGTVTDSLTLALVTPPTRHSHAYHGEFFPPTCLFYIRTTSCYHGLLHYRYISTTVTSKNSSTMRLSGLSLILTVPAACSGFLPLANRQAAGADFSLASSVNNMAEKVLLTPKFPPDWPYTAIDFSRADESDDGIFYDSPRLVSCLFSDSSRLLSSRNLTRVNVFRFKGLSH